MNEINNGGVQGTVTDSKGDALPGTVISLQGQSTPSRSVVSDTHGNYRFVGVSPGQYQLSTEFLGFAPFTETVLVAAVEVTTVEAVLTAVQPA